MANLIDREAAIRLIYEREYDLRKPIQQNLFANAIRNLPSAEPSYEAVMSYCEKRNLALIDCGLLHVLEAEMREKNDG